MKGNLQKKVTNKGKIFVGPLVGEYGGLSQHIINIINFSKHHLTQVSPNKLCVRYSSNKIKKYYISFFKKFNVFYSDIYGIAISRILFPNSKIVHLHGHPYWPEIFLKPIKRKAKYIHTVHQIYFKEDCYSDKEWYMKKKLNELMYYSCKKSDIVISVSKWQQSLLEEYGIKSIYIPNSIDIKKCDLANPIIFRKKYNIYDDFFIFPGDIRHSKRPELFIKLAKKLPDKKFIMIGNGMTKENIINILKMNVPQNVICLGSLPHNLVLEIFAAAKVFILTSKNETFSISLLEAMGCKKVVVVANNAGPKEIVNDGIDGFLFEPDNIESLYEKAVIAWNHPDIGNKAYERVKNEFDSKKIIKKIDSLYTKLLNK